MNGREVFVIRPSFRAIFLILVGFALTPVSVMSLDVPQIDKSSVEEMMKAVGGSIPFPPERLIKVLGVQGYQVTGTAVVPHGRSLERGITSYKLPRTLFSINRGPFAKNGFPVDRSREIFIAYTPGNQQLQIIGASKSRPFDFRVVENYSGRNPEAKPSGVQGGLCLSCHQNGGAIFPKFPWSEMNSLDGKEGGVVRGRILKEEDGDPFARYVLNTLEPQLPLIFRRVASFDAAVREANIADREAPDRRHQTCQNICGSSLRCRRMLLARSLTNSNMRGPANAFSLLDLKEYYTPERVDETIADIDLFARRDLILESSDALNDRVSYGHENEITAGPGNDPLAPRIGTPFVGGQSLLDFLPHDKGGNPIVRSKTGTAKEVLDLLVRAVAGAADFCIFGTEADRAKIANWPSDQLIKFIVSKRMDGLTDDVNWPPDMSTIVAALNGAVPKPSSERGMKKPTTQKSQMSNFEENFREMMATRQGKVPYPHSHTEQLFSGYCSSCHSEASSKAPVLPLSSVAQLSVYHGSAGRTVEQMLRGPELLMPPPGSQMPTIAERNEMLEALKQKRSFVSEEVPCAEAAKEGPIVSQTGDLMKVQGSVLFRTCLQCHNDDFGYPDKIPFAQPGELARALESRGYARGRLYDEIIFRLTTNGADHMPQNGVLAPEEKTAMERYLKNLLKK